MSKSRPYDPHAKREKRPTYTFKTGATYDGEWIGGFRDGYGVQKWPDGAQYEGQWKDDHYNGSGTLIGNGGVDWERYEGDLVQGRI